MLKQFYFSSPLEVVKVTSRNLEEVAEWCGGKVATTESKHVKGRMDPYVWVPTPKGSSISWAFPGMFITKRIVITMKNEILTTYSVFRKDYFEKNFFDTPVNALDATWERYYKEQKEQEKAKLAEQVEEAPQPAPVINVFMNAGETPPSPAMVAEMAKAALSKVSEQGEKAQMG